MLDDPDRGIVFGVVKLVRDGVPMSINEALEQIRVEFRKRGAEPSLTAVSRARAAALEARRSVVANEDTARIAKINTLPGNVESGSAGKTLDLSQASAWPSGVVPPEVAAKHPPAF